ncbi:MAG: hypothetical protein Unbinned97contig1000_1, partial [Prokaryotic dsDNA virus sp.]
MPVASLNVGTYVFAAPGATSAIVFSLYLSKFNYYESACRVVFGRQ